MNQKVAQELPVDERDTYEGSLVAVNTQIRSLPCVITGNFRDGMDGRELGKKKGRRGGLNCLASILIALLQSTYKFDTHMYNVR